MYPFFLLELSSLGNALPPTFEAVSCRRLATHQLDVVTHACTDWLSVVRFFSYERNAARTSCGFFVLRERSLRYSLEIWSFLYCSSSFGRGFPSPTCTVFLTRTSTNYTVLYGVLRTSLYCVLWFRDSLNCYCLVLLARRKDTNQRRALASRHTACSRARGARLIFRCSLQCRERTR